MPERPCWRSTSAGSVRNRRRRSGSPSSRSISSALRSTSSEACAAAGEAVVFSLIVICLLASDHSVIWWRASHGNGGDLRGSRFRGRLPGGTGGRPPGGKPLLHRGGDDDDSPRVRSSGHRYRGQAGLGVRSPRGLAEKAAATPSAPPSPPWTPSRRSGRRTRRRSCQRRTLLSAQPATDLHPTGADAVLQSPGGPAHLHPARELGRRRIEHQIHGRLQPPQQWRRVRDDDHRLSSAVGRGPGLPQLLRAHRAGGQRPLGQQQALLVLRRFVEAEAAEEHAEMALDRR